MADTGPSDYFHGRERQERNLAELSKDSIVAAIHLDLAERYSALTRQFDSSDRKQSR